MVFGTLTLFAGSEFESRVACTKEEMSFIMVDKNELVYEPHFGTDSSDHFILTKHRNYIKFYHSKETIKRDTPEDLSTEHRGGGKATVKKKLK